MAIKVLMFWTTLGFFFSICAKVSRELESDPASKYKTPESGD